MGPVSVDNAAIFPVSGGRCAATIIENNDLARAANEALLDARGISLPLPYRLCWAKAAAASGARSIFISLKDAAGSCQGGLAVESRPSRSLPGHRWWSITRLGIGTAGLDAVGLHDVLAKVKSHARHDGRVLRILVEVFAPNADARQRTGECLREHGFRRMPTERTYERTLFVNLEPDEATIFSKLGKTARQNIRVAAKRPVTVECVTDVSLADRLQQLDQETWRRTSTIAKSDDWAARIKLSNEAPHLSRINVLRRNDRVGPESIIAFSWACLHGDVVHYAAAASTRANDLKIPMTYPLVWDLMRWARRSGARRFDFGGITAGHQNGDDPLGGISDFKRYFTHDEVEVGQQWELELLPIRVAATRFAAAVVRRGSVLVAGRAHAAARIRQFTVGTLTMVPF